MLTRAMAAGRGLDRQVSCPRNHNLGDVHWEAVPSASRWPSPRAPIDTQCSRHGFSSPAPCRDFHAHHTTFPLVDAHVAGAFLSKQIPHLGVFNRRVYWEVAAYTTSQADGLLIRQELRVKSHPIQPAHPAEISALSIRSNIPVA